MSDTNSKNATSTTVDSHRHSKIKAEAYELASARGFKNGNQMEDWLAAEKTVDIQLSR